MADEDPPSYVAKSELTDAQQSWLDHDLIFEQLSTLCRRGPVTKSELSARLYELRDWEQGNLARWNPDGGIKPYTKYAMQDLHTWMGDNLDSILQFSLQQGLVVRYQPGDTLDFTK